MLTRTAGLRSTPRGEGAKGLLITGGRATAGPPGEGHVDQVHGRRDEREVDDTAYTYWLAERGLYAGCC